MCGYFWLWREIKFYLLTYLNRFCRGDKIKDGRVLKVGNKTHIKNYDMIKSKFLNLTFTTKKIKRCSFVSS